MNDIESHESYNWPMIETFCKEGSYYKPVNITCLDSVQIMTAQIRAAQILTQCSYILVIKKKGSFWLHTSRS